MDLFTFSLSGVPGTGTAILNASPTPSSVNPGVSFNLDNISASYLSFDFTGDVTFFLAGGAGGDGFNFSGPQLFSGTLTNPTFNLGTFTLSGNPDLGDGPMPETATLTITQVSAAPVPEPFSLALAGTGMLSVVGAMYRRRA